MGDDAPVSAPSDSITVISYNILCDAYTTDRSFPPATNPPTHLAWGGREPRLLAELASYGADLIFLQEVQADAWGEGGISSRSGGSGGTSSSSSTPLGPALRGLGYAGAWLWSTPPVPGGGPPPRPSSRRPRKGMPRVGPALLARTSRVRLVATASLFFRDAPAAAMLTGGHAATAILLAGARDGAVAAVVEVVATGARFLAASAHINWDYRTPDLKVMQAAALMAELARFWEAVCGSGGGPPSSLHPPPLILGGDFNSLPQERESNDPPGGPSCAGAPSGAYTLLTTGRLGPGHPHHPARQRGGAAGVEYDTAGWGHLASVRVVGGGREPALTTRTTEFEGTLDYVFVSPTHWRVCGLLADPWEEEGGGVPTAADFPPMPNLAWPSDHLAVGAVVVPRPGGSAQAVGRL